MCVYERWESERAPIRYFGDLGMLRGVTRGNRPRLSGGFCEEGGSQLEANVLHHDHSIAVHLFHVLLCIIGLDLTLDISLSLHITLNNCYPYKKKQRAIKLAKPFGKASYIPALWECTLVLIMHSHCCFCDMGSPVLLPCDLREASRRTRQEQKLWDLIFYCFSSDVWKHSAKKSPDFSCSPVTGLLLSCYNAQYQEPMCPSLFGHTYVFKTVSWKGYTNTHYTHT